MGSRRRSGKTTRRQVARTKRFANVGAVGVGAVGIAAAQAIGVGELMVGAFAAYVAYRVLRYGVAPSEAVLEGVELEHGEVPKHRRSAA